MSATIISSLISAAVTLIVCLITQNKTKALIAYRLEELEKKQDKHNQIAAVNHKIQEVHLLNENSFMKVNDVAKELGISVSHAYKIMQQLNKELKEKGYMTIAGRVNRKYFMEKFCYSGTERK